MACTGAGCRRADDLDLEAESCRPRVVGWSWPAPAAGLARLDRHALVHQAGDLPPPPRRTAP